MQVGSQAEVNGKIASSPDNATNDDDGSPANPKVLERLRAGGAQSVSILLIILAVT